MRVISLSSGSKGNVTYVGTDKFNMLIDCGLSGTKLDELLLINVGIDLNDIDLVFLTHAHSDHIMSFNKLYSKYPNIKFVVDRELKLVIEDVKKKKYDDSRFIFINRYTKGEHLNIGKVQLQHDTYCLGWIIEEVGGDSLCFIADNGAYPYKLLEETLLQKPYTYYMIESNYSTEMTYLDKTRSPLLKKRCLGSFGHSSNVNAIDKFVRMLETQKEHCCKGVMFTHLSEETNNEELARSIHVSYLDVWSKLNLTKNIKISYAKQNVAVDIEDGKTHKEIRGVR